MGPLHRLIELVVSSLVKVGNTGAAGLPLNARQHAPQRSVKESQRIAARAYAAARMLVLLMRGHTLSGKLLGGCLLPVMHEWMKPPDRCLLHVPPMWDWRCTDATHVAQGLGLLVV